jgi:hypothetical protein
VALYGLDFLGHGQELDELAVGQEVELGELVALVLFLRHWSRMFSVLAEQSSLLE